MRNSNRNIQGHFRGQNLSQRNGCVESQINYSNDCSTSKLSENDSFSRVYLLNCKMYRFIGLRHHDL